MKKIFYIVFTLLLISKLSMAQYTLSGKITHRENGDAVIGASVYLPELRLGASADVQGNYRIKSLPKGSFTVQVTFVSHQTVVEKIQIDGNTTKDFQMDNSTISLEEVIVSGASAKTIVKESPIPISTMSRIQWLQSSSTNLVDAIAKMPGMSQISTGVGLSKPVIRGLGFNRVITMHDGIRQEDNQWGEEHSIHIDEYSIDRYEIIRGAGSLMYGSDGLGGVMSVLSPQPVEEGKIIGNIIYNYQTNNNMHATSVMNAGNINGWNWNVRASHKNANNYRNATDGRVYGSNFKEDLNLNGMVGMTKKWGYSRIYFAKWGQKINIIDGTRDNLGRFTKPILIDATTEDLVVVPDSELSTRNINAANSQDLANYKISSNNLFFVGKGSISVNLGYSQNHRQEFGNVFDTSRPDLYFFLQTNYYDARYNLPEKNGWETTIGTNGMYQKMNNRGAEVLYPNFNLLDNGAFIFSKKSYKKLKMSGGIRYDIRRLNINKLYIDSEGRFQVNPEGAVEERFKGFEKTFANATGSFGAVYEFSSQFSVKANVARGFRAPAVPEISSNGEHAGTFRYEIGNINQKSEVSLQYDIGMTFENKSLHFDISLFNNQIDNYSYSERVQTLSGRDSIIGGVPAFRYTQGNARLQGIEATFTFNPEKLRWFNFTQTYSMVMGKNLSAQTADAQYLPFMPPPRWVSRLRLTRDKIGTNLRNTYFTFEVEHHQKQDRFLLAYNTETATPSYTLINAGVGADITNKVGKTMFSVYLSAQNLADLVYQNHQNRLKYLDTNQATGGRGVANMGRNLSLKLVVPLEIGKMK